MQKVRPGFINQSPVRIDRQNHTHAAKLQIQRFKIWKEERLAAGQKKEKRAGFLHLARKRNPFRSRMQMPLALHLRTREPDVAHATVHVA